MTAEKDKILLLPDGRALGYAIHGPDDGVPVLGFHGIPGSRLQHPPDADIYRRYPVRLFLLERPGIGLSSPSALRPVRCWAQDVAAFCTALSLHRVAVLGISGGGPYALACARLLPDRVAQVSLVSALGPLAQPEYFRHLSPPARILFRLAESFPLATRHLLQRRLRRMPASPAEFAKTLHLRLHAADWALLSRPEIAAMLRRDVEESLRQGAGALVHELRVQRMEWEFEGGEVAMPLHIYHGTADWLVKPEMALALHRDLPGSQLHLVPEGGHFMVLAQMQTIFSQIIQDIERG